MTERIERSGYSGTTVALALLGGAAAGAAIAMLYAPRSGKETRAMLRDKRDEMVDTLRDARDQVGEVVQNGKEKARAFPGAAKAAGSAARTAFVDAMETSG